MQVVSGYLPRHEDMAHEFMGLFEAHTFCLLNGRLQGDIPGLFTFVSPTGKSTDDLVWCDNLSAVKHFEIASWTSDSDHFPAVVEFFAPVTNSRSDTCGEISKWDPHLALSA
ncbi:Hypothetical protein NTJ_02552 [Nesidiocoris tenuis]|uniref:Endonuclease/exonuclease/phosphatase domain-containing protein n=1 Tax=Nesidiocoris tenuis TaxID=355587 RepID=A0ABN7AFW9_9HEMI|nr:Hypothetical protein NTJ_02552 [Nesidiocoris tenuis]